MENNAKRKKPLTEEEKKLIEIFTRWVKPKQDHELLQSLMDKDKLDDIYNYVNAREIFKRSRN